MFPDRFHFIVLAIIFQLFSWKMTGLSKVLAQNAVNNIQNKTFYTAAVVEYFPYTDSNKAEENFNKNLKAYLGIIDKTAINSQFDTSIDIIVFPEGTLNRAGPYTLVPDPITNFNPCLNNSNDQYTYLKSLSCAAKKVGKYLVINLTEKEAIANQTSNSSENRNVWNIYNTNVVFDRNGVVISRYRKYHLYINEANTTENPEFAIFETDFGVKFGHFICYDILFYTPAQELVEKCNITDIIFTNKFVSELPFLTAVQLQQGWSWANNVNFLAAGGSFVANGSTGSGIYAGSNGALTTIMNLQENQSKVLIAQVPKHSTLDSKTNITYSKQSNSSEERNMAENFKFQLRLLKDPTIQNFTSTLLSFDDKNQLHQRLCYDDFCCKFNIKINSKDLLEKSNNYYRIGVFKGNRTYEQHDWNYIRVCGLYTCLNKNVASCGELQKDYNPNNLSLPIFEHISIQGTFPIKNQQLIMPITLDKNLIPLPAKRINWTKTEQNLNFNHSYKVEMNLLNSTDSLLTFAIYANYYDNYEKEVQMAPEAPLHSSSSLHLQNIVFTIFNTILIVLLASIIMQ